MWPDLVPATCASPGWAEQRPLFADDPPEISAQITRGRTNSSPLHCHQTVHLARLVSPSHWLFTALRLITALLLPPMNLLWPMRDLFAAILTQTLAQNIEYLFWISEHLPMLYDSLLDVEWFRTSVRPICIGTHPGGVVRHGVSLSWDNSNAITEFVWIID